MHINRGTEVGKTRPLPSEGYEHAPHWPKDGRVRILIVAGTSLSCQEEDAIAGQGDRPTMTTGERCRPTLRTMRFTSAYRPVHGVDYLLTWNFRHLANAETRGTIRSVCERQGFTSPEICTPSELIGGLEDV